MTQRIEYNEEMVGNAHPTKSDTLNRFVNLITTSGDLLRGTAAATAERIAKGTARQIFGMNDAGTLPDYMTFPKFSAHKNAVDQGGIVTATWTKITFPVEEYDIGNTYNTGNSQWVPGIIGKAFISAGVQWTAAGDGLEADIGIYKNGVLYSYVICRPGSSLTFTSPISRDVLVDNVADYFEIYVIQTSGGDKIISGVVGYTWFLGHMLP